MQTTTKPLVLCVDDEPNILEGLKLHLRRRFEVHTAPGGAAGLETLASHGPFAVVVSDMRMPLMDGAAFLGRVRQQAPETVRMLLTGQTDLDSAIAAVNEGQIFRFLTKPCPPETLGAAVEAAVEQHRLVTAERVLLEQTLHGSIRALTEILALAHPAAFGRANRVKQHVAALAAGLGLPDRWQLEVAAMLSQIGCITLPAETVDKLYRGQLLTQEEHALADRLPAVTEELLANIPRLEGVREILRHQERRYSGMGTPKDERRGEEIPLGARLLKLVLDFDVLESRELELDVAFDTLRGRTGWYDPALLDAFARAKGNTGQRAEIIELKLKAVRPGMIFAEDVMTGGGSLLVARGHQATVQVLERLRNFSLSHGVREPLRVELRKLEPVGEPDHAVSRT